jgi:hypothetical protein
MADFYHKSETSSQTSAPPPKLTPEFVESVQKAHASFTEKGAATVSFQTPKEVEFLAQSMADLYPNLENALLGLLELMMNAVEHGNLEIGFLEKTTFLQHGTLEQEIEKRLLHPDLCDRKASLTLTREPNQLVTTISDEGIGFDWQPYLLIDERRLTLPTGRGIALANMVCFDTLHYNDVGNAVTATVLVE